MRKKLFNHQNLLLKFLPILFIALIANLLQAQDNSVAIGSTDVKQNAVLWLNGNGSQGLLLPTVANTGNISSPDAGMIVYQTSDNKIYYRNEFAWVEVGVNASGGGGITYTLQLSGSTIELLEDGNPTTTSIDIQSISVSGDIIGTIGATSLGDGVVGITQLGSMGLTGGDTGKILQWSGSAWEIADNAGGGITYTAGTGIVIDGSGQISIDETQLTDADATNEIQDAAGVAVTTTGNLTSTNVQDALEELQTDLDSGGSTDDQEANEVPVTAQNGVTSTDAQAALEELQGEITTNQTNIGANTTAIGANTTAIAAALDDQTLSEVLAQGADANGVTITNLGAPSTGSDAATKAYIDGLSATNNITGSFAAGFTVANDVITGTNIADGTVNTGDIEDGTITPVDIDSPGNDMLLTTGAGGVVAWDDKANIAGATDLQEAYDGGADADIIMTAARDISVVNSGGTEVLTLRETNGFVGIGTNSPSSSLDIEGNTTSAVIASVTNTHSAGRASVDLVNDGGEIYSLSVGGTTNGTAPDRFYIFNNTAGAPVFTITPFQKVGINSSNPLISLDVVGTDAIGIPVGTNAQRPGTPAVGMLRYNSDLDALEGVKNDNTWETIDGGSGLWTDNSPNISFTSGNVGIGTTTPAEPLVVTTTTNSVALRVESLSTSSANEGIRANATGSATQNNGIYGEGIGGTASTGIHGYAGDATNSNIGVNGTSASTTSTGAIIGVQGQNVGATTATNSFGVVGNAATTGSTTNYGVYGDASGGANNYAGFFDGDMVLTGALGLGGTPDFGIAGEVLTSAGPGAVPTWETAGGGWGLTGNAGTDDATDFIGTTDGQDLVFRQNGTQAGRIHEASFNTSFGKDAMTAVTSGTFNTAIGSSALGVATTGTENSALGGASLSALVGGGQNTAIGFQALRNMTGADNNTAIGWSALVNNQADDNIGIGVDAGSSNTTGSGNIYIGNTTGGGNTSGDGIVLIGAGANVGADGLSNATAIGANATVSQDNSLVLGNSANVGIGTSSPSSRLQIATVTHLDEVGGTTLLANNFHYNGSNYVHTTLGPAGGLLMSPTEIGMYRFGSGTQGSTVDVNVARVLRLTADGVVINDPDDNEASAALNVVAASSDPKGFLMPRLLQTERDAIPAPADGLMVYNTTSNAFDFYNGTSTTWEVVGGGGASPWTLNSPDVYFTGGDVGIGTNAPNTELHIESDNPIVTVKSTRTTSSAAPNIQFGNDDGGGGFTQLGSIGVPGSSDGFRIAAANSLFFNTNFSDRMTLTSAGRLGIGTLSPSSPLHIFSSVGAASRSGSVFMDVNSTNTDSRSYIRFSQDGASLQSPVYLGVDFENGFSEIWDEDNNAFRIGTSDAERFRVDGAGNVGIGTTAPTVKLQIDGGADAGVTNGTGFLLLGDETGQNIVMDGNEILARTTGAFSPLHLQSETGPVHVHNNGAASTRFSILDDGSVGIGTSIPTGKLNVVYSTTVGTTTGQQNDISTTGTGVLYGQRIISTHNGASGSAYGISATVAGGTGNTTRGGYFFSGLNSTDAGLSYGVQATANNDQGTGETRGVFASAGGSSTGPKYGIYSTASGSGTLYAGYFDGDIAYTGTISAVSDRKFKENITPLPSIIDKVMLLNPSSYNFKTNEYDYMGFDSLKSMGFIAQEIELLFPEVVSENAHPGPVDHQGEPTTEGLNYKGVNYTLLIPVAIKAIQEQQQLIEDQEARIAELEKQLVKTNDENASLKSSATTPDQLKAMKMQIMEEVKSMLGAETKGKKE